MSCFTCMTLNKYSVSISVSDKTRKCMIFLQGFLMDSFLADLNVYMRRHKSVLFRTHFINCEIIVYLHTVMFLIGSMEKR